MKSRFTTLDIQAALFEIINSNAIGLRVINIYDIDAKTYLIKLSTGENKVVILVESGNRIHLTEFDWPKNLMPSGFSMKCRKHLRGKRLSSVSQLGVDRIIDFCFGYNEVAHHLIIELYDRGNIILADHEYTILQLLRVRKDNEDVRFAVRERYPIEKARAAEPIITQDRLTELLQKAQSGDQLKRLLNPQFIYGPALLEHCLLEAGFPSGCKIGDGFHIDKDTSRLLTAIEQAEEIMNQISKPGRMGYIIQKKESKPKLKNDETGEELLTYTEFHPYLFKQHQHGPFKELPTFNKAVDEFFSQLESQKSDLKTLQKEKTALKKLENVRQDHTKRLDALQKSQASSLIVSTLCSNDEGMHKAALIELNLPLVDQAMKVVNSAIANKVDWEEIDDIVKEAQAENDPVACAIKSLKLDTNQMTMKLTDPYHMQEFDSNDESSQAKNAKNIAQASEFYPSTTWCFVNFDKTSKFILVDVDLSLSAFANARLYHDHRRQAANKEKKTVDASKLALKSAERKTKQTLKEVATSAVINKARKTYWFEKFLWFISSENYIVIAGRDQQQNELLVKRYLKAGDLYVHADLHGASSIVIKNPTGQPVPPRTLNEAGTMAICYSAAWQAKVVTSAWWVYHDQVSKTAPSGEYLTTGSFMIRGKKNYLPPSYLMMGFGIMFKLDESCVAKHSSERRPKIYGDEDDSVGQAHDKVEDEIVLVESDEECQSGDKEEVEDAARIGNDDVEDDEVHEEEKRREEDDYFYEEGEDKKEDSEKEDVEENVEEDGKEEDGKEEDGKEEDANKEDANKEDAKEEDTKEEDEFLYPDTSLQLQYVSGDKYQLQRGVSASSSRHYHEEDNEIYLGDGEKIVLGQKQPTQSKQRMSAKQRRDLKKKSKAGQSTDNFGISEEQSQSDEIKQPKVKTSVKKEQAQQQPPPQPPKRGQKGKQKKKKDKYKDQDEEDKELAMKLLGSAGEPKESRNAKKNKKGSKQKAPHQQQQQRAKSTNQQPLILSCDSFPDEVLKATSNQKENAETGEDVKEDDIKSVNEKTKADQDEDEDEATAVGDTDKENISLLDTLTGCPFVDDLLLFAVPVCAPYNVMQNFKYKVKVTPGTGRKGKAAKTALHLFSSDKEANQREKDLFKSLKDVDISRNIPGKVKISAPKLQKSKK
eukprot:gene20402-22415_t